MTNSTSSPGGKTAPDWLSIRAEYESGEGTVQEICDRHGIEQWQINYQMKREDWPRRVPRQPKRADLIRKMTDLIDTKVTELIENPLGDIEKEAKLLGTLTQSLNKLIELENAEHKARKETGEKTTPDYRHLRERLARRIQKIIDERDGGAD